MTADELAAIYKGHNVGMAYLDTRHDKVIHPISFHSDEDRGQVFLVGTFDGRIKADAFSLKELPIRSPEHDKNPNPQEPQ